MDGDTDLPAIFAPMLALLFAGGAITGVVVEGFHVNAIITWSFLVAFAGFCSACLLYAVGYILLAVVLIIWEFAKPCFRGLGWLYRAVTD